MKKSIAVILLLCIAMLCGCSEPGNTSNAYVDYGKSGIYSKQDMDSAVNVTKKKFTEWDGCELHSITYKGDSISKDNVGYCNSLKEGAGFTECIVFESSFHSPQNGGDGFNPDEEYTGWSWHLARKDDGAWILLAWGYA